MRLGLSALMLVTLAASASAQDGEAIYRQQCASCHDPSAAARAPRRDALAALTLDRIVESLDSGSMRVQGEALTPDQRRTVARFLSDAAASASPARSGGCAAASGSFSPGDPSRNWNGWGASLANLRYQPEPGLTAADVPRLKLKWAFGFAGETAAATQPSIVGERVFVSSASGRVHALGLDDGCVHWVFQAAGGVRSSISIGEIETKAGRRLAAFFGDLRGSAYALDATTGEQIWTRRLEDHVAARVTGSPVFHDGRLYVPMSSIEEVAGAAPKYECCTFRGSVTAVDAATGEPLWKTYTIPESPQPTIKNAIGTQLRGPAGAAVWHAPTIDPATGTIYVATGDGYTHPAAATTDAILALDLKTGAIKWSRQMTEGDAWNMACGSPNPINCPEPEGPDFDFGQPPILLSLPGGGRALVVGQKSGQVHALDPDAQGRVLWSRQVGRGGMLGGFEWGSASDGRTFYAPLSDLAFKAGLRGRALDSAAGGGLHALRVEDGSAVWSTPAPPCDFPNCAPAQSAPASAMPGVVLSGSLDGHLRAYSAGDGRIIWDVDTARAFETVNGVEASGGSIDVGGPAIARGMVLTTSGYTTWGGKPGNVLLAFGVE